MTSSVMARLARIMTLPGWKDFARLTQAPRVVRMVLAIDSKGCLYVASTAGVQVFDKKGKQLAIDSHCYASIRPAAT